MEILEIGRWVRKKGIDLVGTADWTHPLWLREIKANLEEDGSGLLRPKKEALRSATKIFVSADRPDETSGLITSSKNFVASPRPLFLLSTEISSIYSQGGRQRRIHNLVIVPSLATAEKINQELTGRGANLLSDGRPITGISSRDLVDLVLSIDDKSMVIPCHVWTPWFSLYGSMSGFDSINQCFGDMSQYIYGVETGLSCYDVKTEVLTDNGWKRFSKVDYSDKICTLNPKNDEIEYQKPTRIFTYQYRGKMYKLKTKRVDLFVTPNHRLLVSGCDFRKPPEFSLKEAEALFNQSKRFKKDGVWKGKDSRYFTLPAVKIRHGSRYYSGLRNKKAKRLPMKSWLKFFGFWLADGWTSQGKNGDYNVCLSNQDLKLLSEMKQILKSFGYKVYHHRKGGVIRVRDYQLLHHLKQFGKASDKFIPKDMKSLSKDLLKILFEYYIKGDGHTYGRTKKGLSATTISRRLRDDLQEIALKLGMSAYYKLGYKKGTPFHGALYKNRIYRQSEDSWIVYFIRKNIHTVLPSTIKKYGYIESWVDFEGPVFCIAVPNQVIYVRRNGIPVWCGNSDPAMNWRIKELDSRAILSFSDAHSGPKLGREATVFDLEELNFANIREAIVSREKSKILYTIEFYPEEGKYHYTGHRNCNVRQSPEETKKLGKTCPVCGRPLTVGVMHRVERLTTRPLETKELETKKDENGVRWIGYKNRPPYVSLVPLLEILSESLGSLPTSQNIINEYENLTVNFGGEFGVLLKTPIEEIAKAAGEKVAEGIKKVRAGDIVVDPGYDGVFGKVKIWKEGKEGGEGKEVEKKQLSLF